MTTLFRSDGWVKTVLGQAIAGASVYVCTQPANLVNPPTPLASIFADPLGNEPITQPVPTDGFGHYDFYVAYGTYTVVIVNGGNIQAIYPDQTIGFPSVVAGVSSVFGRVGAVVAQGADYGAFYDPLGAAATAQSNAEVFTTSSIAALATTVNTQNTSYVAALTDNTNVVVMNVGSACTFTVPPNSSVAFPVGSVLTVIQEGTGQVTLTAGAGVTINNPSSLTTRTRYSTVSLTQVSANVWVAAGDLT